MFVQISYWIFFETQFSTIKQIKPTNNPRNYPPVSIIICIKNGAEDILRNKVSWLWQLESYDELILVDDFSSDSTSDLLKSLETEKDNIYTISASQDIPGKKQALSDGLSIAKNEFILVTDVDCFLPKKWKKTMLEHWGDAEFLIGFSPFSKEKGWPNLFQRFECAITGIQYLSYANAGSPYMGVGRNLGFKKKVFDEKVLKMKKLASGDDDLLINTLATGKNTNICLTGNSFVMSRAKSTWKTFFNQKTRHVSTSVSYQFKHQFFLSAFSGSQIVSNLLFLLLLFTPFWKIACFGWILKEMIIYFAFRKCSKVLLQKNLSGRILLLDFALTWYYLILLIISPFKDKQSWN